MYEVYTVKFGDTIEGIVSIFNTNLDELTKLNSIIDLTNLKEGMQIMVPNYNSNPYRYYTVKKGDTIKGIADKYNIDYNLLLKLNGLDISDYIYPNQTIVLPKEGVSLYLTKDNEEKFFDFLEKIYNEWENDYTVEMCDGSEWKVRMWHSSHKFKKVCGTIAYPPHGKKIETYMRSFIEDGKSVIEPKMFGCR